jgi:hypothetical protein
MSGSTGRTGNLARSRSKSAKVTGAISTSIFLFKQQNGSVMHLAPIVQKADNYSGWAASKWRRFENVYGDARSPGVQASQSAFGFLQKPMMFFIALQWLDFATTIFGFSLGASELSPVVRSIALLTGPGLAVFVAKILTILAMWRMSKRSAIVHAGNLWYSAIVLWNLVVISKLIVHVHQGIGSL